MAHHGPHGIDPTPLAAWCLRRDALVGDSLVLTRLPSIGSHPPTSDRYRPRPTVAVRASVADLRDEIGVRFFLSYGKLHIRKVMESPPLCEVTPSKPILGLGIDVKHST